MNDSNLSINFNGHLVDRTTPVATVFNRSLRYGDGLFETMYWDGRQIKNLEFHLDRLFKGLAILLFDLSDGFSRTFISHEILKLCEKNSTAVQARIRLNVFREDGYTLLPEKNKPVFIIETSGIPEEGHAPLRLTVFKGDMKSTGILSNLKTNNYLLNTVAIQFAKNSGFDDALILNSRGNICEASSSNIFMVQKGILFTPALTQGCVAGTKRRELLEILPGLGFQVEETIISKDMIFEMEEIFLTNAIRPVRPVICIDNTYYSRELTGILVRLLNGSAK
ncbi:MAG: aminotransferase class IV [Bacteroidota bacterium]|nr:aminotransferase class IV [Bacteroidota bacterium]